MKKNHIEKEHFSFRFKKHTFDAIFSICGEKYELLLAIHAVNWGCLIPMESDFSAAIDMSKFQQLKQVLKLNPANSSLTPCNFLFLVSRNVPSTSSLKGVSVSELRQYVQYRSVDEQNKIYFRDWNDHVKDGRKARNFDKTEFFFGYSVAEYCRKHNVSSLWTDVPKEEQTIISPPGYKKY